MENGPDINALMEQAKQSHEAALLVIGVLLDLIEKHKGDIGELKKLLAQAQAIIDKLKKPAKNSSNSGKSSSTDQKPNGESKPKDKANPHTGKHRPLHPNPDVTIDEPVQTCPHCSADVSHVEQEIVHQYDHVEIPLSPGVTTRVVLHAGTCPCCAQKFRQEAPAGMDPHSPFGENLRAVAIYLRQVQNISYERLRVLFKTLYKIDISEGALASIFGDASAPFAEQSQTIRQDVIGSDIIASDETGVRVNKKRWWMWVFHSKAGTCFMMSPHRSKKVPEQFLGPNRPKFWISDRLGSQKGWSEFQQACLSHLFRDIQYAIDCGDTAFAPQVGELLKFSLWMWHNRAMLVAKFGEDGFEVLRRFVNKYLDDLLALPCGDTAAERKLRGIFRRERDRIFVHHVDPRVDPTNNGSERRLRPTATFRKVTNCFRSAWGAHFHADVRSVIETARMRGIDALTAIRTTLAGLPLPAT